VIILSVIYGWVVGWLAKELLHWAEERKYVDRESFLVFAITLALFIVGTAGMMGSDDVLACFIAGNAFTWDDWFRLETVDDSLQPTIDMLLNVAVFMWFGAICPWYQFAHNNVIPIYRLVPLGILILLLRRIPIVLALHKHIHQIEELKQAIFVGFFGPIGVSAVFYLYISLEFLREVTVDGVQREDVARLGEVITVVVWFLAICSIVIHGISIPLGKLGFYLPRTISAALSSDRVSFSSSREVDTNDLHGRDEYPPEGTFISRVRHAQRGRHLRSRSSDSRPRSEDRNSNVPSSMFPIGNSLNPFTRNRSQNNTAGGHCVSLGQEDAHTSGVKISGPSNPRRIGRVINPSSDKTAGLGSSDVNLASGSGTPVRAVEGGSYPAPGFARTIRFRDEEEIAQAESGEPDSPQK